MYRFRPVRGKQLWAVRNLPDAFFFFFCLTCLYPNGKHANVTMYITRYRVQQCIHNNRRTRPRTIDRIVRSSPRPVSSA